MAEIRLSVTNSTNQRLSFDQLIDIGKLEKPNRYRHSIYPYEGTRNPESMSFLHPIYADLGATTEM